MRRLWDARACGRWPGEGGDSTPQLELCQEDRQGCRRNRQRWSHQVRNCQPIRGFATQSRSKVPDPIKFWHSFELAQLSFHNSPPTLLHFQGCSRSFHRHEPQVLRSGGAVCAGGTRIRALRLGRLRPRVLEGPEQGGWGEHFPNQQMQSKNMNMFLVAVFRSVAVAFLLHEFKFPPCDSWKYLLNASYIIQHSNVIQFDNHCGDKHPH